MWLKKFWLPIAALHAESGDGDGEGDGGAGGGGGGGGAWKLSSSLWLTSPSLGNGNLDAISALKRVQPLDRRPGRISLAMAMTRYIRENFNATLNVTMLNLRREACTRVVSHDQLTNLLNFLQAGSNGGTETLASVKELLESFLNTSSQRMEQVYARNNTDEIVQQRKLQEFSLRVPFAIADQEISRLHDVFDRQMGDYARVCAELSH
jgi:hypothetical protein